MISFDPVGRQTRQVRDGLGRLIRVDEPDASGNLGSLTAPTQPTYYTFNVLDKQIQSNQGGQLRSWQCDALARLTSETTPEAGTVIYQYNDFNKMTLKRDARGVETHWEYDGRNQVTRIFYTGANGGALPSAVIATPETSYTYDSAIASRLLQVSDGLGAESYSYDTLGRVVSMTRTLDNVSYVTQYVWNEANQVVEMIYPSGRRIKTLRDTVGRMTGLKRTNASGGVINTYVSTVSFQAGTGLLSQMLLGNNTREDYTYDSQRLQMTQKQVVKASNNKMLFSVSYNYQAVAGQAGPQAGNAGQIMSVGDSQQGSINYEYDSLARLKSEYYSGYDLKYIYSYDRWANMVETRTETGGQVFTESAPVQTNSQGIPTNRYSWVNGLAQGYDGGGNLTDDGTYVYKYDAAGRLREVYQKAGNVLQQKFWYDAAGRRIKKEDHPPGATAHWYYCLWSGQQVLMEYQTLVGATFTPGTPPEPAAGTDTLADLRYQHGDIRSVRLVSDGNGLVVDTQGHTAYGEVMDGGGQARPFFTTYEREMTGLDYAMARYFQSTHRRFTSPDRYRGSYGWIDPQTLNRFAYVANDPVNRTDPTGQALCYWVQLTETYGYMDCTLDRAEPTYEPVDPPQRPAGPCVLPSWDKLNTDIKRMVGSDSTWNGLSNSQKAAVIAIVAGMLMNGLNQTAGFESLRIVGYGDVSLRFSGAGTLEQEFRTALDADPDAVFHGFVLSPWYAQLLHGFRFGVRANVKQNSLHLNFEGNGIMEAHIDLNGTGLKHFFEDTVMGFGNDPNEFWQSLNADPQYRKMIQMLLDCPLPPDNGNRR